MTKPRMVWEEDALLRDITQQFETPLPGDPEGLSRSDEIVRRLSALKAEYSSLEAKARKEYMRDHITHEQYLRVYRTMKDRFGILADLIEVIRHGEGFFLEEGSVFKPLFPGPPQTVLPGWMRGTVFEEVALCCETDGAGKKAQGAETANARIISGDWKYLSDLSDMLKAVRKVMKAYEYARSVRAYEKGDAAVPAKALIAGRRHKVLAACFKWMIRAETAEIEDLQSVVCIEGKLFYKTKKDAPGD